MLLWRRILACGLLSSSLAGPVLGQAEFRRGDSNADARLDVSDAIFTLGFLFVGGTGTPVCLDAADADDNGRLEVTDAIRTLGFLFLGALPIAEPLVCGLDPTADGLSCAAFPPCAGPAPPDTGETPRRTLAGNVRDPEGRGIPGVEVSLPGAAATLTDARGDFVLQDPPAGIAHVHIEGGTAQVPGSRFAALGVITTIAPEGPTELRPAITLPDLNAPASVAGEVPVNDMGQAMEPIEVGDPDGDMALSAPAGTTIRLGEEPAQGRVEISITPVEPEKVPMPLSQPGRELDASSFVSIQPADGFFEAVPGRGLDVVLPNHRNFPLGTMVDIWSFDHHAGAWVNRSDPKETGMKGVVVPGDGGGTRISASGVITAGGWHAPVIRVDPACATVVAGRVVDLNGAGIPEAHVALTTGNLGRSGAGGAFALPSVPAYVAADLPACTPLGFRLEVVTPVGYGAATVALEVPAGLVQPGGMTDVGAIEVPVGETGAVAGRVTDNGAGVAGLVSIRGPTNVDVLSDASGYFFVTGLRVGLYTASFLFVGETAPTVRSFEIHAGRVSTINLQRSMGSGSADVRVRVVLDDDDDDRTPFVPAGGAFVMLVGTDPGSRGGVQGITNDLGDVFFKRADGPFTVTAQIETAAVAPVPGGRIERVRVAATVVGINPPAGTIGIPLFDDEDRDPVAADATLSGTLRNLALLGPGAFLSGRVTGPGGDFFDCLALDVDGSGRYSVPVPSGVPLDLLFLHTSGPSPCGFGEGPLHVLVAPSVGPAAPGATIVRDFDVATDAVPFDRAVAMTYQNLPAVLGSVELNLLIGGRETELDVGFQDNTSMPPSTLLLPDPAHPALRGLDLFVELVVEEGEPAPNLPELFCSLKVPPGSQALTVPLPGRVVLNQPSAAPTLDEARSLLIDFTPSVTGKPVDVNLVEVSTRFEESGSAVRGEWVLLVPPGTTSLRLPLTVLPMLGVRGAGSGDLEVEVEEFFSSVPFDFDAFFNEDVDANLSAVDSSDINCGSNDGGVDLQVLPNPGG